MQWLSEVWRRVEFFFRKGQLQRELREEMDQHLRMKAEDLTEEGMQPDDARKAAKREFGNALLLRERSRDAWGLAWLEALIQDLRYGLRQLRRNPGFTTVAVVTLALGIGANTAIFSMIDGVFLRSLPYPQSSRLVYPLWVGSRESEDAVGSADYLFWKAHSRVFDSAGAYGLPAGSNLVVGQRVRYIQATPVTSGLFATLGVSPALGRDFTPEEGQPNGPHAVILSYNLWRSLFPAGHHAIGHTLQMN